MSGGSLDYVFGRVDDAAATIASRADNDPLQMAFVKHLAHVSKVLKALEWAYSCDTSYEDDAKPMLEAFFADRPKDVASLHMRLAK